MNVKFDLNDKNHCYLLGYFWADCYFGWIRQHNCYRFSFEIKLDDFVEIWPLLQEIGFVKYSTRYRSNLNKCQAVITCSKKIYMEIFEKYFFHKKTFGCPLYFNLSQDMRPFFMKGFLDGDGSISLDKNKAFRVSFNGAKDQNWDFLEDFCLSNGCKFGIYRKDRINNAGKSHSYSVVEILKNENKLKFCEILNLNIGLKRKMQVFEIYRSLK